MGISHVTCRCCQSTRVKHIGRLPAGKNFAGKSLPQAIPGGDLWRCGTCFFLFRSPVLNAAQYDQLYETGSDDFWSMPQSERRDFQLISQLLGDQGHKDVLDVGCYTGQFLASLPASFRKYGIEINHSAADMARARGVDVLANTIDELSDLKQKFSAVIACDVIEHVSNPLDFLGKLRALLYPGGKLIITTGDADAWLWRLMGARFWYCHYPEHISFVGQRWLKHMPGRVGLSVDRLVRFNYLHDTPFSAAALAELGHAVRHALNPRSSEIQGVPGVGATRDHIAFSLTPI